MRIVKNYLQMIDKTQEIFVIYVFSPPNFVSFAAGNGNMPLALQELQLASAATPPPH